MRSDAGRFAMEHTDLVVALGSITRMPSVPGLREHALDRKDLAGASRCATASCARSSSPTPRPRAHLAGSPSCSPAPAFAGVETIAELEELTASALERHARLAGVEPRRVLVDQGPRILGQAPDSVARFAARTL